MNGFQKFNINHLSASSINLFKNAPDVWCVQYLLKKRTAGSPAMSRGIAVEDGVVHALSNNLVHEDALQLAYERFDCDYKIPDEIAAKERSYIGPMLTQSLLALKEFGVPDFEQATAHNPFKQEKILLKTKLNDGSIIEVIGYLDLVFGKFGLVVDLKTTTKCPTKMSPEHCLQAALYARAKGNAAVKFLYVTPKKFAFLENENVAGTLAQTKTYIRRINEFLLSCHDENHAISIVPHNPDSFYWRGAEQVRQEIFNT